MTGYEALQAESFGEEIRDVLQGDVDEEYAQSGIDEDVEKVERARVFTSSAGNKVRKDDIEDVNKELAEHLLRNVERPDFPFAFRLFSLSFVNERAYDEDAHDGLYEQRKGTHKFAVVSVHFRSADDRRRRGGQGRVGRQSRYGCSWRHHVTYDTDHTDEASVGGAHGSDNGRPLAVAIWKKLVFPKSDPSRDVCDDDDSHG